MKVARGNDFRSGLSGIRSLDPAGWVFAAMNLVFLVCAVGLGGFLLVESVPVVRSEGLGFWLGENWWVGETIGALPMIYGSLIVTGLAVIMVLPVALAGALFISEYLPPVLRRKSK